MDEVQKLLDRLDRRLATGDRLSATFARELAAVWRDAERALRQLLNEAAAAGAAPGATALRGAVLLDRVRRVLRDAGYDQLVTAAASTAVDALLTDALKGRTAREAGMFVQNGQATMNALREIATVDLLQRGDEVATALWRSLAQHLFTTRPQRDILEDLADALDSDLAHVRTLFDTQVAIFNRQIEATATADDGPAQAFLYSGPVDDRTRDWCLERVGKVFTREEIDAMDNGQLPNAFLTGGGYNCRHVFMAVESQELKDLAGTGWRAPEYDGDVQRVEQRKSEKRRKKAA